MHYIFSFPTGTRYKGMKSQQSVLTQWAEVTDWVTQLCIAELLQDRNFFFTGIHIWLPALSTVLFCFAPSLEKLDVQEHWASKLILITHIGTSWLKHSSDIPINVNRRQNCGSHLTRVLLAGQFISFFLR